MASGLLLGSQLTKHIIVCAPTVRRYAYSRKPQQMAKIVEALRYCDPTFKRRDINKLASVIKIVARNAHEIVSNPIKAKRHINSSHMRASLLSRG
jgi:hypothetical protein